jgi:uncharacterized protein with NRDE domain
MCLILLAYRCHPDVDVLLAGNRDEFLRRAAAPPGLVQTGPRIWAGRDLEAGGTWMGRNEHGLLAALTNRRSAAPPPPEARSRGELVLGLLRQPTPESAARWLAGQPHGRFRPYSVLFGDARAFHYFSPQDSAPPRRLEPGAYALSNAALDDASWPKVERSQRFLRERLGRPGAELLAELQRFLCDPTPADAQASGEPGEEIHGAMGAVFIRGDGAGARSGKDTAQGGSTSAAGNSALGGDGTAHGGDPALGGYGTVSSSIFTRGGRLGDGYWYAERAAMIRAAQDADAGQPFRSPFRPIPLE